MPPTLTARRPISLRPFAIGGAVLAILAVVYFFTGGSGKAPEGPAGGPMPVAVATVAEQTVRTWTGFSGRLKAVDDVEIRPRVGGTIDKILFEEGAMVKKGAPLFIIDPRPYEAAVAQAEGALNSARTNANLAQLEMKRAAKLIKDKFVPQSTYDSRANDVKVTQANIKSAEAALRQAKLNLEYAHITAPVSGRVSRAEITVGNVIEAGPSAPVLTTIVSNSPIYAEFDVDEQTYMRSMQQGAGDGKQVPVQLTLTGDEKQVYSGSIKSFDNRLDPTSGTIRARAVFANEKGVLVPGMFANIQLGSNAERKAILISDKAIGTDQDKKFVYVVGPENKVVFRIIQPGGTVDGQRIVEGGLQPGEKIIVGSIQRIRPDMVVAPQEAGAAPPAAPATDKTAENK